MNKLVIVKKILPIILKAQTANETGLKELRQKLIKLLEEIGAKQFVSVTAEILKNNFRVEGCNDARIPLKRIFAISLEELQEVLPKKKYNLDEEHPIFILSQDHTDNIEKLKKLSNSLDKLEKNSSAEEIKDYYTELDLHIRKEEEILFPALEKNGMKEHPDNLREEHKGFRKIFSELNEGNFAKLEDEFIPAISNHIFREAFIFYPAALEFIADTDGWEHIKKEFNNFKQERQV